jgi:hypothetical protein
MTISECVRSSLWWGVVKSLGYYRRGPVGLLHTQKVRNEYKKPSYSELRGECSAWICCRVSRAIDPQFCKPKVGSPILSTGTTTLKLKDFLPFRLRSFGQFCVARAASLSQQNQRVTAHYKSLRATRAQHGASGFVLGFSARAPKPVGDGLF